MFTIGGWSETQDPDSVFVGQTAMNDAHLHTDGDSIIVPSMNHVIGCAAISTATALRHRLISPTLRRINSLEVTPIIAAAAPAGGRELMLHPEHAIPLTVNEELSSEDNAATVGGQQEAIVWLADGPIAPMKGEVHHIHFTVTLTTILNTWVLAQVVLSDDLPIRNYDLVGAQVYGANIVAFRIAIPGHAWRPGALCQPALNTPSHPLFRNGGLGVWATFNPISMPALEICSSTAAGPTAYHGCFDVIPR